MSRHDIYRRPHKALRAAMADTLVALGRADPGDDCEMREAVARLEELLGMCEKHAALENEFVHRAIEDKHWGASSAFALDHHRFETAIDALRGDGRRRDPGLYRRAAAFVADNLRHMEEEESAGNAVLWELFTDAELVAIERRLVASIPPGDAMRMLRWMVSGLGADERVEMFQGLRMAPAGVMAGALAVAEQHLQPAEFARLEAALAQREPATVES